MGCGQIRWWAVSWRRRGGEPGKRLSERLGLRLSSNNVVRVVGPGALGMVGSAFGLPAVFWLTALLMGAGAWWSRRHADDGDAHG